MKHGEKRSLFSGEGFAESRLALGLAAGRTLGQAEQHVPVADDLYDEYLAALTKEGLL
jgi:hypothetical protein